MHRTDRRPTRTTRTNTTSTSATASPNGERSTARPASRRARRARPGPHQERQLPRQSELLTARVRTIIDREEDGNVAAAARRIGVSQRGLQKIYAGRTQDPRCSMILRLASTYRLDPSWLLTGITPKSDPYIEREATRRATLIVSALAHQAANDGLALTPLDRSAARPQSRAD